MGAGSPAGDQLFGHLPSGNPTRDHDALVALGWIEEPLRAKAMELVFSFLPHTLGGQSGLGMTRDVVALAAAGVWRNVPAHREGGR